MTQFLQQLVNGLSLGAIYALIALGYTMVYGTLQLINFAHSEVYMMGAFASLYIARMTGVADNPTFLGVTAVAVGGMVMSALLGMAVERFAYRPMRGSPRLNILITAIGMSLLLQNVALLSFGAMDSYPQLVPALRWEPIPGLYIRSADILTLSVTLVLMVALHHLVERTRIGRAMRAVSHSRDAAALMGIPVDRIISITFAIGSGLAGAAAFLISVDRLQVAPNMGASDGLKAFVAAVLGGIGSIPGAVAGGLLLGICETLVAGYIASTWRDAIAFILLILILLYRPAGLLGKATVEKV